MQPMRNNSSADVTAESIDLLKRHLIAASDLHVQIKQAHWNLKNLSVDPLNKMFGKVAAEVAFLTNRIEEHAVEFGIANNPCNETSARRIFLVPYPRGISEAQQYVFAIYGALAAFSQSMRHASGQALDCGDPKTASLFAEISSAVDGQARFVESHLASR